MQDRLLSRIWGKMRSLYSGLPHGGPVFFVFLCMMTVFPFLLINSEPFSIQARPEPINSSRPMLASHVMVIIVDGLGADSAFHPGWMLRLQRRMSHAAFGKALVPFPTVTAASLRTIFSGHHPVPRMVFPGGFKSTQEYDSLFSRASAVGLRSYIIGQQDWALIYGGHGARIHEIAYHGPGGSYDIPSIAMAREIIDGPKKRWDLLVLHLFDLDVIGHAHGVGSPQHTAHLMWLDQQIEALAAAVGPRTCVLITADHGQNQRGSHGGMEKVVREVPFVLWGPAIQEGFVGEFPQENIAPTLAVLMGLPPPAMTEGWPELKAIRLSDREKSAALMDLLHQRLEKWYSIRDTWHWLSRKTEISNLQIKKLFDGKLYDRCSRDATYLVEKIDATLEGSSPRQWIGKLMITLWLGVLAACFSLAWPQTVPWRKHLIRLLCAVCLIVTIGPLLRPGLWSVQTLVGLCSAFGVMVFSLLPGFKNQKAASSGWVLWVIFFLGIAFPVVVDTMLWSWMVLWSILIWRYLVNPKKRHWTSVAGLGILLVCSIFADWAPETGMSMVRSLLPQYDLRVFIQLPWLTIETCLIAVLAAILTWEIRKRPSTLWTICFCAVPLILIAISSYLFPQCPQASVYVWIASLAYIVIFSFFKTSADVYWICLSLVGLAFFRSLSDIPTFCYLVMACLIGWRFAWSGLTIDPFMDGLGLLSLALWGYLIVGGHMDFSNISVTEGYQSLRHLHAWTPRMLVVLVIMKKLLPFILPVILLLSRLPVQSLMCSLLPLGSLAAGSLTVLWIDHLYLNINNKSLLDDPFFEKIICCALLAWILIVFWVFCHFVKRRKDSPICSEAGEGPVPLVSSLPVSS